MPDRIGRIRKDRISMNRNRQMKIKKAAAKMVSTGLAAVLASVPAFASVPAYGADGSVESSRTTSTGTAKTEDNTQDNSTVTNTDTKTEAPVRKEETVYINADANGKASKTTVSSHLVNTDKAGTIDDVSDLSDIENVKGDEKFTQNGDKLTWSADGNDIYYEGTSTKEAPVSVRLTYKLDGKEIAPKDLVGKSGKLTLDVSYENHSNVTVDVDGTQQSVSTPFLMMTGMLLPEDHFSNVTIDNGRILDDGSRSIVIGYGMPGLSDSLKLSDLGEKNISDLNINSGFEITADVTDFSLDSTFTVAVSDLFDKLDKDDVISVDDFNDAVSSIQDAGVQLVDGSKELFDGATLLDDKYGDLNDGISALKSGVDQLAGGSNTLSGGLSQYVNGVNTLANGTESYTAGAQKISDGAAGLSDITEALKQVKSGTAALTAAFDGKGSSTDDLVLATQALAAGTKQLNDALGQVDLSSIQKKLQDPSLQAAAGNLKNADSAISTLKGLTSAFDQVKAQMSETEAAVSQVQSGIGEQLNNAYRLGYGTGYAAGAAAAASAIAGNLQSSDLGLTPEQIQQIAAIAANSAKTVAGGAADKAAGQSYGHAEEVSSAIAGKIGEQLSGFQKTIAGIDGSISNMSSTLQALETLQPTIEQLEKTLAALPKTQLSGLVQGVSKINGGAQQLSSTVSGTLAPKIAQLNSGVGELQSKSSSGIKTLQSGLKTLTANNKKLTGGAEQLKSAGSRLTGGADSLISGVRTLDSGAAKLQSGSTQVQSGLDQLADGAGDLNDGMKQFNEEAIQKIVDFFDGDLKDLMNRVDALKSDEASYTNFSGKADGTDSSVKFLIETDAISSDD